MRIRIVTYCEIIKWSLNGSQFFEQPYYGSHVMFRTQESDLLNTGMSKEQ